MFALIKWCFVPMNQASRLKVKVILRGPRLTLATILLFWAVTWAWMEGFKINGHKRLPHLL